MSKRVGLTCVLCAVQGAGRKRKGSDVRQAKEAHPDVGGRGVGLRGHSYTGRGNVPLRPQRGGRGLAADRQPGVCRDG